MSISSCTHVTYSHILQSEVVHAFRRCLCVGRFSHQLEIGSISTIDVAELRAVDFSTARAVASSPASNANNGGIRSGFASPGIASITASLGFASATQSNGPAGGRQQRRTNRCALWMRQIVGRARPDDDMDDDTDTDSGRHRYDMRRHGGTGAAGGASARQPTRRSFRVVKCALVVQLCAMVGAALTVRYAERNIYQLEVWAVALTVFFVACVLLAVAVTAVQPQRVNRNYYKVPLVACTASTALFASVLLVGQLDYTAWVRFAAWLAIGVPVFLLARRRSEERKWRTTGSGISKIQAMHNRGFMGGSSRSLAPAKQRVPAALAVQTAAQMVEICEVDETSEADEQYVVPLPPLTSGTTNETDNETTNGQLTAVAAVLITPGGDLNNDHIGNEDVYATVNKDRNNNSGHLSNVNGHDTTKQKAEVQSSASIRRTPSPSSSYDDIVLASDIMESLSERKEPNGKTYYLDVDVNAPPPSALAVALSSTAPEATVMPENDAASQKVVSKSIPSTCSAQRRESAESLRENSANDAFEMQTSTIALVHMGHVAFSDEDDDDEANEDVTKAQQQRNYNHNVDTERANEMEIISVNTPVAKQTQYNFDGDSSDDGQPLPASNIFAHDSNTDDSGHEHENDTIGNLQHVEDTFDVVGAEQSFTAVQRRHVDSAASDSNANNNFKERLSMLLAQNRSLNRQTSAHVTKLEETGGGGVTDSPLPTSKSVGDLSTLDATGATLRQRFTVTDVVLAQGATDAAITPPPAPAFNADLYNGLQASIPTPDYDDDNNDEKDPPALQFSSTSTTGLAAAAAESADEPSADDLKVSIRAKLESILSRGPPARVNSFRLSAEQFSPIVAKKQPMPEATVLALNTMPAAKQPELHEQQTNNDNNDQNPVSDKVPDDNVTFAADKQPNQQELPHERPEKQPSMLHRTRFQDVLRSIASGANNEHDGSITARRAPAPQTRRPTLSNNKPATIADARNSLRHVDGATLL